MAKKLSPEQARKLAYSMYMNEDMSWVEIADAVGYTAVSVGNWAREGSWKDLKEALTSVSDNQLRNFASQLNALNTDINGRAKPFPTTGEADIQIKLSKSILMFRGEADLTEILAYNRMFLQFVRTNHPDKLKDYALLFDEFIKEKV